MQFKIIQAFFIFLLISFSNCNMPIRRTALNLENTSFEKFSDKKIVLRAVEFPDSEFREIMEITFKTNLKIALEKGIFFSSVDYYHEPLEKETLVVDLRYSKYSELSSIHPLYLPGSILTLTLYIWFGGPVASNTIEDSVKISVFDRKGQLIFENKKDINFSENQSLYSLFNNDKDKRAELLKEFLKETFRK